VTLPYLHALADQGVPGLFRMGRGAAQGVNVHSGKIYHEGVATAFGLPYFPLPEITV
jgi:alanine dehydrogenase